MNMPGFNMQAPQSAAPFQMLPPEVLAQLAAAGFRPPQGGSAPGLSGGGQPTPGFNVGDGMGALGAGLGSLKDLFGYKGDPMASAAYGSARPAIPVDVLTGRGWIGGGI